ncbi:Cmr6 family CRISPR-associated RAMP protein (plasmid) [Planktothrix tepida]|uniref:Cmr6 family CRISPR-associated RAMP protein n=1 Tax=Planktothrix tepida PCC 9214 TaxID=671072 RepID=A0A1J1LUV6_9CYAN|nr:RAMP superfamily CRISPR-associated protein [Planktothrix tepida]CAD5988630.1 Cmr6 family CRISPR-associated RAMP protein [Planktothrix tepida]CUR36207.1 Cmr6 family CRISPR-associated RAMP protein [Planktothrix tepida PCC 9214]
MNFKQIQSAALARTKIIPSNKAILGMFQSPLQALNQILIPVDQPPKPILEAAVSADQKCEPLYTTLTQKTRSLADEIIEARFSWRLRVGGMRGFQELLLPVLHPVYGIPYIPSSSLKGAVKAWARKEIQDQNLINRLLGQLDQGVGCVQILDAFPTKPCLSLDITNPQWEWQEDNRIKYKTVPHTLLSMAEPTLIIGLTYTHRGQQQHQSEDLKTVKTWMENALAVGIGSRVSAGYGRTQIQSRFSYSSSHPFQLWTQGIFGADPKKAGEFRPVALRGVLRYWFRAIALGLYDPVTCRTLENQLFGKLSQEGTFSLGVNLTQEQDYPPYFYAGDILLESRYEHHLLLMEKLLFLTSHIAGIGRGSRRPLHRNNGRMRGCHWELNDYKLPSNLESWQSFLQEVQNTFLEVQQAGTPEAGDPGNWNKRYQDVLNHQAVIYLVPSPNQIHPDQVKNWSSQGATPPVLGTALNLLYSNDRFKGKTNKNPGNVLVGGTLGIPSFVIIQSNFPKLGKPYQTVTVFGANNSDRQEFIRNLPSNSIQVWPLN